MRGDPQSALGRARTEVPYFRGEEKGRSRCSLRDRLCSGEALRTSEEGDLAALPLNGAGGNMAGLRVPPTGPERVSRDTLGCGERPRFFVPPHDCSKGQSQEGQGGRGII